MRKIVIGLPIPHLAGLVGSGIMYPGNGGETVIDAIAIGFR